MTEKQQQALDTVLPFLPEEYRESVIGKSPAMWSHWAASLC